jgi:hypothetical protein
MLIDYFNDCARARSLSFIAQIKIMEESLLVFIGLSIFAWLQESRRLYLGRKKSLKILKIR